MQNIYPFSRLESFIASQLGGRRAVLKPFGYVFNFATLTAGLSGTSTQKLNSNGFFFLTGIIAVDALNGFDQLVGDRFDTPAQAHCQESGKG